MKKLNLNDIIKIFLIHFFSTPNGIIFFEREIMERNLVGKNEQDLVMFGNRRDEKGSVEEDSLFSGSDHGVDGWMDEGSNNWNGTPWIKWESSRPDCYLIFHNQFFKN